MRSSKKIGEILVSKGLITEEVLNLTLKEQKNTGEFLGEILLRHNYINDKDLIKVLSEQFGFPVIDLENKYIDINLFDNFSKNLIFDYYVIPIKKDDFSIVFAIHNPLDAWAMQKAQEEAGGFKVKFVLATKKEIEKVIDRYKKYKFK